MSVQVKGSGTIGGLDEGLVVSGIVTSSTQINVGSNIKLGNAGVITATSFSGAFTGDVTGTASQVTIAGGADNRVVTAASANTLQGEAKLTFDGTGSLHLNNSTGSSDAVLKIEAESGQDAYLALDTSNGGGATADIRFQMDGTTKGTIEYVNNGSSINDMIFRTGSNTERLRITSNGALGTNSTVRSAYGGLDLCSQGASNYGTLTLGAGGGQNGQSRSSNQENQFRIMMPTYANPALMTTVLYGTSGSAGHDLHYGGGTGWSYATNSHRFFTTANQTTGTGTERLRISSNGRVSIGNATNNASPAALLGVIADDGEAADLYVGSFKNLEATAGQSYGVNIQAGSNSTDHGFRVMNRANNVTQFLVRGDGRIGINETSPDRPMHIKDPAQIKLESTATGNWSGLEFMASSGTNNWDAYMGMNDSNGHFFIDNNSNGNDFVIDRYGYVTKPSQPSFAAFQSQSSWSVNGTMVFNSTRHNVGNHYSTSNGRFTAPTAGSYLFNFFSIYRGNHTSGWVSLYKNGSRMTGGDIHFTYYDLGSNWDNVAFNQVLYLSANEYVDMRSAQTTDWHGNNWQCFSGYLLG